MLLNSRARTCGCDFAASSNCSASVGGGGGNGTSFKENSLRLLSWSFNTTKHKTAPSFGPAAAVMQYVPGARFRNSALPRAAVVTAGPTSWPFVCEVTTSVAPRLGLPSFHTVSRTFRDDGHVFT